MTEAVNRQLVALADLYKAMTRTDVIDGYSYEINITQGRFDDPHYEEGVKLDPNAVYLNVGVVDEVNGITHDHQVFDLTNYCERVYSTE